MGFTAFLFKNLLGRKVRSFLITLAIALAVGVMVTLLGISEGFEDSFRNLFAKRGVDLVVLERNVPIQLLSNLDEKVGDQILKIPGVKAIDCGMSDQISIRKGGSEGQPDSGEDVTVIVQGYHASSFMFEQFHFLSGGPFKAGQTGVALLGVRTANMLDKKVGDYIKLDDDADKKLKVIGIYEGPTVFENGFVLLPLTELQKMKKREGSVTGFSIILEPGGGAERVQAVKTAVEALKDEKGRSRRLSAEPLSKYVSGSFHIQLVHAMAWMTSVIAVGMGALGMFTIMLMAVFERVKEIGILRAIGWRKSRVIRMVLGESLLLCLAGAAVGIVGAIFLTRWLTTFPQVFGYIEGKIPNWVVLEGALMAAGIGVIGGLYPALRAANLKPTEALRHE